jgi:hypothetical protein
MAPSPGLTRIGPGGYVETVSEDEMDAASQDFLRLVAELADRLDPPGPLPGWAVEHIKAIEAQGESVNYVYLSARVNRAFGEAAAELAQIVGAAAARHAPAENRRPPVKLVVLVVVWLILVVGPLADGKLPAEVQTMLGTEVGTIALGLAITQTINQKRK